MYLLKKGIQKFSDRHTGIAELIALEISKQTGALVEETRKRIWLVDSKGLIVQSCLGSLQHFKKPWAHEHELICNPLDAVKSIKPTVLIGSSGAGRTFTKEVVETMSSLNESNNAYIFPGFSLGLIISGAIRVNDDMLLTTYGQFDEEYFQQTKGPNQFRKEYEMRKLKQACLFRGVFNVRV